MEVKLHKLGKNELNVYSSEEDVNRRILRGRMLYDKEEEKTTFVENQPRGPRSSEVGRTGHARLVKSARNNSDYKITIRVNASEKYLKETLLSEVRNLCKLIDEDVKNSKKFGKEVEDVKTV